MSEYMVKNIVYNNFKKRELKNKKPL